MSGYNRATLVGHLGRDPEVRRLNNGNPVVSFSLATSETWRDKQTGERREKTEWHNVVIYNEGLCKVAENYLKKGSKCLVEGKIKTRKWQDQSGADRWSTEIVLESFGGTILLLDRKNDGAAGGYDDSGGSRETTPASRAAGGATGPINYAEELDDEIPF
jgi:single-strand DNA-binding protein